MFERYIEESGLKTAFQIIFAEIVMKKVKEEEVFKFASKRLNDFDTEFKKIEERVILFSKI